MGSNPIPLQHATLPTQPNYVAMYGPCSESKANIFAQYIAGLSAGPPFFKAPLQGQFSRSAIPTLNYPACTHTKDLQETRHLAWCYKQILASHQGKESVPTEAAVLLEEAEQVLVQFNKSVKNLAHIQELVALGTIDHTEFHRKLINALLDVLKPEHNRCLDVSVLNGLCRLVLSRLKLEQDPHAVADRVVLLKALLQSLQEIQINQNCLQARTLLDAVSLVLDQMVDLEIEKIDREKIQEALRQVFDRYETDLELAWPVMYARQALARLPNDKTFWEKLTRYLNPAVAGGLYLTGGILKLIAGSMASPSTALTAVIIAGFEPDRFIDAFRAFRIGIHEFSHDRVQPWYVQLRLVDVYLGVGLKTGRLDFLENLLNESNEPYDENFLRGLCDRLERIACARVTETTRDSALSMLKGLSEEKIGWGKLEAIKEYAKGTLDRIGRWQRSDISVFNIQEPDIQEMERGGYVPPGPHAFWEAVPKKALLQEVHNIKQHADIVVAIPDHFNEIQRGLADIRINTTPASVSLGQVRTALKDYYERLRRGQFNLLSIQRVSGEELSLEDCYINLAIVESLQQREQEKKQLQKKPAVFNRMGSYEQVTNTNIQAQIELKNLFNERILRNGKKDKPSEILIQGRPGSGKSTLCKKLVYEFHKENGLWQGQFDAVLWLPLRQLKSTYTARNLEDLLREKYFAQHVDKEALARTLAAYSDRILFILDGLDEVSTETANVDSPLGQFITTLLKQPHIMLTSRPSGVDHSILPSIDLELETIGFSQENVQTYLQKVVAPETVVAIQDFIKRTPVVQGLVNIPVQLDVLCFSWNKLQTQVKAGHSLTMTSLYKTMISQLMRNDSVRLGKSSTGMPVRHELAFRLKSDLFKAQLAPVEEEYLSYLAFQGIQDGVLEFDDDYLQNILSVLYQQCDQEGKKPLLADLLINLGQLAFLHTTDTDSEEYKRAWHFLHLTFQEFFAAKFLVRQIQKYATKLGKREVTPSVQTELGVLPNLEELEAFIATQKYNPRYEIVWQMVAGLLNPEGAEQFFKLLNQAPRDLIGIPHQQLILNCLQEARARLKSETIVQLEQELMLWLDVEIKKTGQSVLGRQHAFPESLLLNRIHQAEMEGKGPLLRTLCDRSRSSKDGVKALIDVLKDTRDTSVEKVEVMYKVALALRNHYALPAERWRALIDVLNGMNAVLSLRTLAAEALGKQSALSDEGVGALIDVLKDTNEEADVRSAAARALRNQSTLSDEGVGALIDVLKDTNEEADVRSAAAWALRDQFTLSDEWVGALVDVLKDTNAVRSLRTLTAEALGNQSALSDEGVGALIDVLKDANEEVDIRSAAVRALGNRSTLSDERLGALIDILKDTNAVHSLRTEAVRALRNQSTLTPDGVGALIDVLKDTNAEADVRTAAVWALRDQSTLSDERVGALIDILKDTNAEADVRTAAVWALRDQSTLSDERVEALIDILKDTNAEADVRSATVEALCNQSTLSDERVGALIGVLMDTNEDADVRSATVEALCNQSTLSDERVGALIYVLKDGKVEASVRTEAARILGKQSALSDEGLGALINVLKDTNEGAYLRSKAVLALRNRSILPPERVKALTDVLRDTNEEAAVRSATAEALGGQSMLPPEGVRALIDVLMDTNAVHSLRTEAVRALRNQSALPPEGVRALIDVSKDTNVEADVRSEAVWALRNQSTCSDEWLGALIDILKDTNAEADVISATMEALRNQSTWSDEGVGALIKVLKDTNAVHSLRTEAAWALGKQSALSDKGLGALTDILMDKNEEAEVRSTAACALSKQSALTPEGVRALIELLKDTNANISKVSGILCERSHMIMKVIKK